MGRSTKFYKLNKILAKKNLLSVLLSESNFDEPFKKFIEKKNKISNENIAFVNIIKTVDLNINTIQPIELWHIIFWLEENNFDDDFVNSQFGITEIMSLHNKTSYGFMFQLGDYELFRDLPKEHINCGQNLKREDFIDFMNYMILLMNNIIKKNISNEDFELTDFHKSEIIKIHYEDKVSIFIRNQILSLQYHYKNFLETNELTPEVQIIFSANQILDYCIEAKNKISQTNTNIIIADSF